MSFMVKPLIATFEADGVITKGKAVKFGSTNKIVSQVSATTDLSIGIAQNTTTTAGDLVEVALPGGGAKALAKASITKGNILGHNADGSIQKLASASDKIVGQAMDDAAAGDLFSVNVLSAQGVATQA